MKPLNEEAWMMRIWVGALLAIAAGAMIGFSAQGLPGQVIGLGLLALAILAIAGGPLLFGIYHWRRYTGRDKKRLGQVAQYLLALVVLGIAQFAGTQWLGLEGAFIDWGLPVFILAFCAQAFRLLWAPNWLSRKDDEEDEQTASEPGRE